MLETIGSPDEVNARIFAELHAEPAAEVRKSAATGRLHRIGDADARIRLMDAQRGTTRYRTLVRAAVMEDPILVAWHLRMQKNGDEIRVTGDHLQPMILLDRDRAFLPLEYDNPGAGAVFIRHHGAVGTLADLFDRAWPTALDLDVVLAAEISPVEQQVLAALVASAKDEVAARRLSMSVRTFRRHVSDLMERLQANTRFQLAVTAKDKGWM